MMIDMALEGRIAETCDPSQCLRRHRRRPQPTQPGQPFTHVNNWFASGVSVSNQTQLEMKADHLKAEDFQIREEGWVRPLGGSEQYQPIDSSIA